MNPSIFKLAITKPCMQDWDSMLPTEGGRHCLSCKKQVMDFSKMDDIEIQDYFLNNNNLSTCGRFYTSQLERIQIHLPKDILNKPIAVWKKYLACLLICFGTQLFPVDIFIGQPSNIYAQTVDGAVINKKKVKRLRINSKRHHIYFKSIICTIPMNYIVMGYTQTAPSNINPIVEISKKMDTLNSALTKEKDKATKSTISLATESNTENKEPLPKNEPYQKFEFILPDPFKIKKNSETKA